MSMTLLIERHYLKGFLKLFLIISIGLSLIISLIDLIDKLDEFMLHNPSAGDILLYPLLSFPKYLTYLMPLGGLLAGLYTLGQASRTKEIVAIMSVGGRIKRLLMPFVALGVLLSLIGFGLAELVVPATSRMAKDIKGAPLKAGRPVFREGTVWLRAKNGSIVRMNLYLPERNLSRGISIFKIEEGRLKERIEAEEALYEGQKWALKNAVIYDIEQSSIRRLNEQKYPHLESPRFLSKEVMRPEEMGIIELARYVRKLNEAGLRNIRLMVDMNSKISYPLINLFMLMLGISFSVRKGLGGLLAGAIGLAISLIYWLAYTMALSLGYAGILSPFLSAWLVPLIFSAIAVHLFRTIQE